ncbi:nicotinate (nicotinamide) nucleotide adenylyltransferase [Anaerofustis stercorihominis]|uniref:Probable nicotinate-nucleotide adenylyltransferase n=1 Tax=Anaerofustis stercorihominis DSM 17244 TaxID=445971 RepID=B1C9S8_9FIRM|nr:nicotinate (nicotinamide) nucleotide adenylyltransferase [Anaerofustis stercorihominis]EDS72144.1 nicotinate-nucleotide adenylyltransferase [Anaerofustis stercorihominis DSM 17244]MCQ4795798.1 nicotinate (nicotinamide) nucleotide adenylyltransferase [Anaerofustis stercorihominis]
MKVGFIGGSFNPIHNGHINLALAGKNEFDLDKVIFIPNSINPIKENKSKVSIEDRVKMVELAIEDHSDFEIDTYEVDKKGISYTIDTVEYLKNKYNDLYFIGGADLIFELHKWKDYEKLLKEVDFIIAGRNPYKSSELKDKVNELNNKYDININILKNFKMIDLSSSEIRNNILSNNSLKIPKKVAEYIIKNNLYYDD